MLEIKKDLSCEENEIFCVDAFSCQSCYKLPFSHLEKQRNRGNYFPSVEPLFCPLCQRKVLRPLPFRALLSPELSFPVSSMWRMIKVLPPTWEILPGQKLTGQKLPSFSESLENFVVAPKYSKFYHKKLSSSFKCQDEMT